MCRYISAFHHPVTGEVLVADLNSHGKTEALLGLDPAGPYREMHYLPTGEIGCRLAYSDVGITSETIGAKVSLEGGQKRCEGRVREKWPTFAEFETWAKRQPGVKHRLEMARKRLAKKDVEGQWAHQKKEHGKRGNISFTGDTIYSYGWWPMARIVGKVCLFRDERYSVSTAKHQAKAREAARNAGKSIVLVQNLGTDAKAVVENHSHYREMIRLWDGKAKRARKACSQLWAREVVKNYRKCRTAYNRLVKRLSSSTTA